MIEGHIRTFTAGEALEAHRRIKLSSGNVVHAGDEEAAIGVTEYAVVNGELVAVRLINAGGTIECCAAGAISASGAIYAAADGKVEAAGTTARGFALEEALADGDIIECLFTVH